MENKKPHCLDTCLRYFPQGIVFHRMDALTIICMSNVNVLVLLYSAQKQKSFFKQLTETVCDEHK